MCGAGLSCKSTDAQHFLMYQHTAFSEEQRNGSSGEVETVHFDFNEDASATGESEGDGEDDENSYGTTVINLVEKPKTATQSADDLEIPKGLTLTPGSLQAGPGLIATASFRTVEEWVCLISPLPSPNECSSHTHPVHIGTEPVGSGEGRMGGGTDEGGGFRQVPQESQEGGQ